jgi:transposase
MQYLKSIEKFVENQTVFCGIDIHKKFWVLCYLCNGEVVEKHVIPGELNALIHHTRRLYHSASRIKFVYEAGFSGYWLQRQLTGMGYECIITPPSRIPTHPDKVKTDKRDAKKLARYLSGGLLKEVYVPSPSIEADRQLLRLREGNKKKLTRVKNQINSLLHLHGLMWRRESGCRWTRRFVMWLKGLEFEEENFRYILDQYLSEYYFLRDQIACITRRIRGLALSDVYSKNYKYISSCKGIGLITAMTFLVELCDMDRFRDSMHFSSYLGLTPGQYTSGEHVRLGHITHEGNAHLRGVLIESAWTVIRYDLFLREKYDRIKARGTNGKKAIVAVARSLAIRLRRCVLYEEPYVVGVC